MRDDVTDRAGLEQDEHPAGDAVARWSHAAGVDQRIRTCSSSGRATASADLPGALAVGLRGLVVFGQAGLWGLLAVTHARLGRRNEAPEYTPTHEPISDD